MKENMHSFLPDIRWPHLLHILSLFSYKLVILSFLYSWLIFHFIYASHFHLFCLFHLFHLFYLSDRYLYSFHFLATVVRAAKNVGVQLSLQWGMEFSRYMPRSEIAGSYGNFIANILKNFYTDLHKGCISSSSHQQRMRVLISPHLL